MSNAMIGLVLLAAGILLVGFGLSAADSPSSEVSEFVQGTPNDRSLWLLIGGAVAAVAGLVALLKGGKQAG